MILNFLWKTIDVFLDWFPLVKVEADESANQLKDNTTALMKNP